MKNIIPFKKDVIFKTNLSEVTSISLEHTLNLEKDIIKGDFIISGDYKVSDKSTTVEPFNLQIPFEIVIDERYDTDKATIDIDDFYYEIVNNNILSISIDLFIDKLQEKTLVGLDDLIDETKEIDVLDYEDEDVRIGSSCDLFESLNNKNDKKEESSDRKEDEMMEERNTNEEVEEKINSLFNQFSKDSEVYVTYNVFILRDGDSLDMIMEKYNVTEEELKKYNDLSNLQLGDKIIIPNTYERD